MIDILVILLLPLTLLGQLLRFEPLNGVGIFPHDFVILIIGLILLTSAKGRNQLLKIFHSIKSSWLWLIGWTLLACIIQIAFYGESLLLLLYVFRTTYYLLFLSWFFRYFRSMDVKTIMLYWMSAGLFGIITLALYLFFPDLRLLKILGWDDHYFRAVGSLLDPNFTGIVLVISILNSIDIFSHSLTKKPLVHYCVLGFFVILLGLTFSRASWLALIFGLMLMTVPLLLKHQLNFWRTKTTKLAVFSLAVLIATIALAPKPGGEGVNLTRSISITARQQHDRSLLSTKPAGWIIGSGLAMSPTPELAYHARMPNNLVMILLAFSGIPGLMIFLWHLLLTYKKILIKYPAMFVPLTAFLFFAQFNAALIEPFTLMLCGFQLIILTTRKQFFTFFDKNL